LPRPIALWNLPDWNADKGSWLLHVMPYIEQDSTWKLTPNLDVPYVNSITSLAPGQQQGTRPGLLQILAGIPYDQADTRASIIVDPPIIRCPSDGLKPVGSRSSSYNVSAGPHAVGSGCGGCIWMDLYAFRTQDLGYDSGGSWNGDTFRDTRYFPGMGARMGGIIRISNVEDGLSNTLMLGETTWRGQNRPPSTGLPWAVSIGGPSQSTTIVPINTNLRTVPTGPCLPTPEEGWDNWCMTWGFRSYHPNGANFALGDGSVRFLNQNIDHTAYQLLGARRDRHNHLIPADY
jgi:prepilin-type processing-associated H-X9-DG protein